MRIAPSMSIFVTIFLLAVGVGSIMMGYDILNGHYVPSGYRERGLNIVHKYLGKNITGIICLVGGVYSIYLSGKVWKNK